MVAKKRRATSSGKHRGSRKGSTARKPKPAPRVRSGARKVKTRASSGAKLASKRAAAAVA